MFQTPLELFDTNIPFHNQTFKNEEFHTIQYEPATGFQPTGEEISSDDSRYAPLAMWLQEQEQSKINLTFETIESIIQDELPPSARQHRNWWANDKVSHTQSQQWLDVGWRVSNINMSQGLVTFSRIGERQSAYIEFFNSLLPKLRSVPNLFIEPITNSQGRNWFTIKITSPSLPSTWLVISFARRSRLRLEHYIGTNDRNRNKSIFDHLHCQQASIEADLGYFLSWERLYGKVGCRIALYRENSSITDSSENLEKMQDWLIETLPCFYKAIAQKLEIAYRSISNVSSENET